MLYTGLALLHLLTAAPALVKKMTRVVAYARRVVNIRIAVTKDRKAVSRNRIAIFFEWDESLEAFAKTIMSVDLWPMRR